MLFSGRCAILFNASLWITSSDDAKCNDLSRNDQMEMNEYLEKSLAKHLSRECVISVKRLIEPRYEKTGFLHMRKQRRRSASR